LLRSQKTFVTDHYSKPYRKAVYLLQCNSTSEKEKQMNAYEIEQIEKAKFFGAAWTKLVGYVRGVRSTAAECTSARVHHS
jgi:hypothetical protein